jgi:hypothetical protein
VTDAVDMNTFANSTRRISRQITRTQRNDSTGGPVVVLARRIATWWSDDPMTATFSVERERDERLALYR